MRRYGCQECDHQLPFENYEVLTVYPGIINYTCPECNHKGTVYTGTQDGFFDTEDEVWKRDKEARKKDGPSTPK